MDGKFLIDLIGRTLPRGGERGRPRVRAADEPQTDAWRIFAIAFGQRGLAFRLAPTTRASALAEGGVAARRSGRIGWHSTVGPLDADE